MALDPSGIEARKEPAKKELPLTSLITSCFLVDGWGGVAFFLERLAATPVVVMAVDAPALRSSWSTSMESSSSAGWAVAGSKRAGWRWRPFFSLSTAAAAGGWHLAFFMEEEEEEDVAAEGERGLPMSPPDELLPWVVLPPPLLPLEKGRFA